MADFLCCDRFVWSKFKLLNGCENCGCGAGSAGYGGGSAWYSCGGIMMSVKVVSINNQ